MAKKKASGGPAEAEAKPKRKPVDIDEDLHRKVSVIAGALGMSIPDYVNNRLRPIAERELADALARLGLKVVQD